MISLEQIQVASPCSQDWEKMKGDQQVRFCDACHLSVYNLSGMTRTEAEALVSKTEGRLCVRFFRRQDGTILTNDCPIGLAAKVKQRYRLLRAAILSLIISIAAMLGYRRFMSRSNCQPLVRVMGDVAVASDTKGKMLIGRALNRDYIKAE